MNRINIPNNNRAGLVKFTKPINKPVIKTAIPIKSLKFCNIRLRYHSVAFLQQYSNKY